ncbi:MAG: Iron-sulfur cluster insertion protein ErpA [Phycisphaerae bacterium]|nr:Iron-sulfur cluster insertion protein ErpA [Phycisphaerae bacterium]
MSAAPETKTTPIGEPASAVSARQRAKTAREGRDIHLTETAAGKIKEIIAKDNYPDTMYLYVGVKGGGCSGLQYQLDLRDEAHAAVADTDEVFESQGIVVVSDLKSYVVGNLSGTTIDYQESMMGAGFTFHNPNAKHTCGCGSSYTA